MTNPVGSGNADISTLLQILSPVLSGVGLSGDNSALSPSVQSALETAAPADVVQFSQAALQLVETGGLFGSSAATDPSANLNNFLQTLSSTAFGTTPAVSPLAAYQGAVQAQQADALFSIGTTSGTPGTTGISLVG
jgi:hypothetical protein